MKVCGLVGGRQVAPESADKKVSKLSEMSVSNVYYTPAADMKQDTALI